MKVTLHRDARVQSVEIRSDPIGPIISLELPARDALSLLDALSEKRAEITVMATQFYDCKECGDTHHISYKH